MQTHSHSLFGVELDDGLLVDGNIDFLTMREPCDRAREVRLIGGQPCGSGKGVAALLEFLEEGARAALLYPPKRIPLILPNCRDATSQPIRRSCISKLEKYMSKPIAVGEANFHAEVIASAVPVLVDFWATWCGPCKAIAPELEALAAETEGKLKIVKVDVDANNDLAAQYGIRSIPTLLLFKNGELVDNHIGLASKQDLLNFVQSHI